LWRYWDKDEERYATSMPRSMHISGKEAHGYVRVFSTPEEAVRFFGNENASLVRMHLMASPIKGFSRPGPSGSWVTADILCHREMMDGTCVTRKAGIFTETVVPVTIRDLRLPIRETGFIGWPGGLGEIRHTLAFTCDGRRFHLQEDWPVHH
jgi:hypothetical protein